MPICNLGLLSRKSLIAAKVQSALGLDAVPTAAADAVQVADPVFSIDPNVLDRNFTAPDLSPFEHVIGRKLASISFTTELKSNGSAQSGLIADEPRLGRLFRGCGYESIGMEGGYLFNATDDVNDTTDIITILNHRYETGDGPVQVTVDSGLIVGGLVIDTDYWIIRTDADNIQIAASKSAADAGTEIVLIDAVGVNRLENVLQVTEVNADANNPTLSAGIAWTRGTLLEADRTPDGIIVTEPVLFTLTVTTPGASATAEVTISNNTLAAAGVSQTGVVITDDAPITLGTTKSGATITAVIAGDLVTGDTWRVMVYPRGVLTVPVSDCFDYLSIYLWNDGLLYKMIDAQGTFTVDATAGNYGTIEFTFTGQFQTIIDTVLPTDEVFETTLPQQIELSLFTWGSNKSLLAEQWTLDQANNVVPRPDINLSDGFSGVRISDRTPAGGFNPQAELVATENFWGDFSTGKTKVFTARAGTTVGNQVIVYAPRVQVSEIGFGDRDGIRTFDMSMLFKRLSGNDEVEWVFA